jgi:hypothetical protein
MHSGIRVSAEGRRGCGYRKKGGLYLCGGGPSAPCGRIPFPLDRCPTCDHGIKPTRGWTWVDIAGLLRDAPPCKQTEHAVMDGSLDRILAACSSCPLREGTDVGRVGLLWVQQGYPTTASFLEEARAAGISRRLVAVPKGFKVGESWVMLAHRKVVDADCPDCGGVVGTPDPASGMIPIEASSSLFCETCAGSGIVKAPGIFSAFIPDKIEVIVDGTEPDEEIDALLERGLSPVKVEQVDGPAASRPGSWADHVEKEL